MTHEELRALLPAYAAGALDEDAFEAVRAHLTGGCLACLNEIFERPVGLPRSAFRDPTPAPVIISPSPPPPPPPASPPPPTPVPPAPTRPGLIAAVVVLALALAAAVGWMVVELRSRAAAEAAEAGSARARLAEAEAARTGLAVRVEALERELAAQRAAAREAAAEHDARAQLAEELDAVRGRLEELTRALRQREREIDRLRLGLDGRDALHELVTMPGLELLRLRPVAPFRDARGHALWRPGGETVVVYAFGLPTLAGDGRYRVRLAAEGGREAPRASLVVSPRGDASAAITLDPAPSRIEAIEIVLEPANRPILAWQRGEEPGPRP